MAGSDEEELMWISQFALMLLIEICVKDIFISAVTLLKFYSDVKQDYLLQLVSEMVL